MGIEFNADEIFEIAEQIERNGAKFYRKVAKNAEDAEVKQLLLDLAAMEDDHEKTFSALRAELPPSEKWSTAFDPDGEAAQYLRTMAGGYVFDMKTDPSEKITGKEPPEEILKTAIGLEKDSIVFYLGMRDMVPEDLGKARIEAIVKEEMRHIRTLAERLAALEK